MLLFDLCAWIQRLLKSHPHDQPHSKDSKSRHSSSQTPHRNTTSDLNDGELGAVVSREFL